MSASVFEPPAGVAGLDDVVMVGQAVEHGSGHLGIAEDLRPIGECQVGGDEQRGVLVEFADQVEQQLAAGLAERQIAEFIDDDEIVAQQRLGQPAAAPGGLLLFELVGQIDEVEEPASGTGADHRRGETDAQIRLPSTGAADKDRIAPGVQECAGGKFAHQALIDRRVGKDELVEVLEHRELGAADAIADRARLAVRAFGPEQAGDERIDLITSGQALAGNRIKAGAHAVELQFAHGVQNLMTFHHATCLMLS